MKKLLLIFSIGLFSCNDDYYIIDTKVIKGKVSAKEKGHLGRVSVLPKIYIQDNKHTIIVGIPFDNENDYDIGDSITLVIQQVEKIK